MRNRCVLALVHERRWRGRQERLEAAAVVGQRRAVDHRAPFEHRAAVGDQQLDVHVLQAPVQRGLEARELFGHRFQCRVVRALGRHGPRHERVSAHADRLVELVPGPRRQQVQAHAHRARTLSEQRHVLRRTAEAVDVLLHPVQRGRLVHQTPVTRRQLRVVRKETQYTQPVRRGHHDHLSVQISNHRIPL